MGILNVTPDSFSGDGLLDAGPIPWPPRWRQARRMAAEGADLLDIGGESTRPGHAPVERRRGAGARGAGHRAPCARPCRRCRSASTPRKAAVAAAALDAGADLLNDVTGVPAPDAALVAAWPPSAACR